MTQRGELSGFKAYIDENQEVIKTGMINVNLQLQPVGYAKLHHPLISVLLQKLIIKTNH